MVSWFGHVPYYMKLAQERGCKFILIDPVYNVSAECLGAQWIPIRPGTDTAFGLAVAHVLHRGSLRSRVRGRRGSSPRASRSGASTSSARSTASSTPRVGRAHHRHPHRDHSRVRALLRVHEARPPAADVRRFQAQPGRLRRGGRDAFAGHDRQPLHPRRLRGRRASLGHPASHLPPVPRHRPDQGRRGQPHHEQQQQGHRDHALPEALRGWRDHRRRVPSPHRLPR